MTPTYPMRTNTFLCCLTDPQEKESVLFPATWAPKAALGQLGAHVASLRAEPPIKPGALDPYEPSGGGPVS